MSRLVKFAKQLRKNSTDVENIIWYHLRAKRFLELKFRRQEPIGKYIVDFVCYQKKIIIELDGGQHTEQIVRDIERDLWFTNQGYKIIRLWNNEFLQNQDEALELIAQTCFGPPSPHPLPSREG